MCGFGGLGCISLLLAYDYVTVVLRLVRYRFCWRLVSLHAGRGSVLLRELLGSFHVCGVCLGGVIAFVGCIVFSGRFVKLFRCDGSFI